MKRKNDKSSENQWLEALFQNTPEGIVVQNADGIIMEANPNFAKICNHPLSAIIGQRFDDLLCPTTKAQWSHDFDKLIKGEWSLLDESCMFADGHKIPVEIEIVSKTVCRGEPAIILLVRNVSVYHTIEDALMASQNQWEMSFNAIDDEIYILDKKGRILRANETALKKITVIKSDPIGSSFFDIFRPKGVDELLNDCRFKVLSGHCAISPIEFAQINGKFSLTSYPIKNVRTEPGGCIVVIKDITEQCRQEAIIKAIETKRQRSSRIEALGRMAGGIAHDFNNLLTTLLGYVSLVMQSDNVGQTERNQLVEIMRTVERGTALTRQLFDFSASKKAELKVININNVIQNIHKMLMQVLGPGITISYRLDQRLWNVEADVSRIERILMNFATNSRDAMPSGGEFIIETSNTVLDDNFCKNHPELKAANYVLLQVTDTGMGMPPEIQERIFEPFFTTKTKSKGMGLGLSSVFGIVRQFKGEIICYSEIGRGTTFKVYLPQSTGKIAEEKPMASIGDLPGGTETILIVDDEIHIVSMLTQILTKIGYKILSATNSSKAISLSQEYDDSIDIVLSDIIMPDMNGVELITILREKRPHLKAIFMSGYTSSMAMESTGMDKNMLFLQKPFTFEELARKIRESMDKNAAAS